MDIFDNSFVQVFQRPAKVEINGEMKSYYYSLTNVVFEKSFTFPANMLADYYRILELPDNAGISELKKAFREKAKMYHPDINQSASAQDNFIRFHTAYEMILAYLTVKEKIYPASNAEEEKKKRQEQAARRAEHYARMKYEEFKKECDAYKQSPYKWLFRFLYYGLFFIYLFCALLFIFIPIWAGVSGGIFYFLICLPLFVLSYFTFGMAFDWKKEIDPLFE